MVPQSRALFSLLDEEKCWRHPTALLQALVYMNKQNNNNNKTVRYFLIRTEQDTFIYQTVQRLDRLQYFTMYQGH